MSPQEEQENFKVSTPAETEIERENIEEKTPDSRRDFILTLVSNIFFLISSILYVSVAVVDLQWEENIKGIPAYVLEADDDSTWEPYYFGDDYVFKTPNSDIWVSRYQILYFSAAFGFILVGIVDSFHYPWFLGAFMILAGCFGVVSAMLVEEDEDLSLIFNMVSVHLFCIEAFFLYCKHSFFGALKIVMGIADLFFIIGTLVDVVLSYLYWAERSNIRVARVAIFSACCWLVTGIIYTGTTIYIRMNGGYDSMVANEGGKEGDGQNKNASQITDETEEAEEGPGLPSTIGDLGQSVDLGQSEFCMDIEDSSRASF